MTQLQCSYTSQNGSTAFTLCAVHCCPGNIRTESEACCELTDLSSVYFGASVITVSLVGFLCLCLACICFKEKIFKKYDSQVFTMYRETWSYTQTATVDIVEPKGPPAYDTLDFPPPYILVSETASVSTRVPETKSFAIPDTPPPAYTEERTIECDID